MSEVRKQIEKIFAETFTDSYGVKWQIYDDTIKDRILGLLADYVCKPREEIEAIFEGVEVYYETPQVKKWIESLKEKLLK